MRRWLVCLIIALLMRPLGAEVYSEYVLKAAYLYNFTKFVEWPQGVFPAANSPLVICIAGADSFGDALTTLDGKMVEGHPVEVRLFFLAARPDQCHVVFIGRSEQGQFKAMLAKLARLPILTVSDISNFSQAGGIIGFFEAEKRIRFSINIAAAEQANLKLSSQLLKLAVIVGDPRRADP
ncbi:MAG TPA: YfiR family protein [Candidatus Competibacteraceae bacterium]|nr:YfiR family protein [Gammaproteobacteria bacterium]HPF59059.1 YfiR family protein [Candidatus Competibacteraceae bacterium]HRY19456.1 YfiR family protein [Candidatus Competibacteraceae bacterium]